VEVLPVEEALAQVEAGSQDIAGRMIIESSDLRLREPRVSNSGTYRGELVIYTFFKSSNPTIVAIFL